MEVIKTVTLNLLEPTSAKQEKLIALRERYKEALIHVVAQGVRFERIKLQTLYYRDVREFGLHSQIAVDLFKDAVAILSNGGEVGKITVPYNIPRSGGFSITGNGHPVVSLAALNGRVALSIAMDGAYQRYMELLLQGYASTHLRLSHHRIHVTLKKNYEAREG